MVKEYDLFSSESDECEDDPNDIENLDGSNCEFSQVTEEKTYTPKSLNSRIKRDMAFLTVKNITVNGTIISVSSPWRGNSGMGFKLRDKDSDSYNECKVWFRDGCDFVKIKKNENKNCTVIGVIKPDSFPGATARFVLNVTDIEDEKDIKKKNDTKFKKLKQECEKKGYFQNKKAIDFQKIKKIGIITKKTSQGYNDFVPQLKIPLEITVKEISLESKKTGHECIHAISELQDMDIIIISRGGGDTSNISEYWDQLDLFSKIRSSKVPIITAMGHREDKGDKLLITNVSDDDYATPSTAAYEIKKKILNPVILNINNDISNIDFRFNELFNREHNTELNIVEGLFNDHKNQKIGGQIVKLDDTECGHIIIEINDMFYKQKISYNDNDKLNLSHDDIEKFKEINKSLRNKDIKLIQEYFKNDTNKINHQIEKIIKLKKKKENYKNVSPKCYEKMMWKKHIIDECNELDELIKLSSIYKWYISSLEKEDKNLGKVFNFWTSKINN